MSVFSLGFLTADINTLRLKHPVLQKETGVVKIIGRIKNIHSRPHSSRFIMDRLKIEHLRPSATPYNIRLNVNTNAQGVKIGDIISILAVLSPPPQPVIPGGYDFARYAYFNGIGATGYAVSDPEVIKPSSGFGIHNYIYILRRSIIDHILAVMKPVEGNIASALLVGEKGGIDKKSLENIRQAGIAHILAISGLHLSLVATIFFFTARAFLALFPTIALNYNIKKWAACISIMGSFAYLLISGSSISAQRAFIMTTIFSFCDNY